MTRFEAIHQAEALRSYVRRGGSVRLWWQSKGFSQCDQRQILAALRALDAEDQPFHVQAGREAVSE